MLSEVVESIRQDVTQFREAGNFFRSAEDGGRLLLLQEPLELGQRYCVLGHQALSLLPFDVGVRITDQREVRGWHFCEIELPRGYPESARELADAVGRCLGKLVRSASVRVWPIDPPPHHIDADGTLVYPTGAKKIVVRRSGHCEVDISGRGQTDQAARVRWLDEEWGEIDVGGIAELSLFRGDQEQFCAKVEECERFTPLGIQVHIDHGVWNMFDVPADDAELNALSTNLRLVCPSERVAVSVPIDPKAWVRNGETLTFVGSEAFRRIDAGGFGVLQTGKLSKPLEGSSAIDSKQVWIEGVMTRLGGPTMVNMLPWRKPYGGRGPFQLSTSEELSWLGTYIRAAKGG